MRKGGVFAPPRTALLEPGTRSMTLTLPRILTPLPPPPPRPQPLRVSSPSPSPPPSPPRSSPSTPTSTPSSTTSSAPSAPTSSSLRLPAPPCRPTSPNASPKPPAPTPPPRPSPTPSLPPIAAPPSSSPAPTSPPSAASTPGGPSTAGPPICPSASATPSSVRGPPTSSPTSTTSHLTYNGRAITPIRAAGLLRTGGDEDSRIYIPLETFTELTGTGPTVLELQVPGGAARIESTLAALRTALPTLSVSPVRQLVEGESRIVDRTHALMFAAVLLIALTVAVSVLATLSAQSWSAAATSPS